MLAVVVLAAGQSRRFNGIKQLAEIEHQELLINRQLRVVEALNCPVFLVLGAHKEQILNEIKPELLTRVNLVDSPDWSLGIGHSLSTTMNIINEKPEITRVLITLLDQPCVKLTDLQALIKVSSNSPHLMVGAQYNEQLGVPAIFPRSSFSDLQSLVGDQGAKKILNRTQHKRSVLMPTAASDIDTQEQLMEIRTTLC